MATKVKGNAIKEGSIPLSALSNEVKDKIENASGANWEAKEGEAGYIENKPFGIGEELIPLDMIVKFSQLQKVSVDWASNVFDVYLHPDPGYDSFISKDINPDADDILNIKEKGAGRVFGYSINNKMIYEEIDHNNFNQTLDGIDTQFDFVLGMKYSQDTIGDTGNYFVVYEGVMYVIHNITYNKIYNDESYMNVYHTEKIHENYLPDTILKTIPQTLSDDAKNQALANLGIPRVLNINIYGIEDNLTIDELSEILGDCVTNEILILGLCYRSKYSTVYLPTLHQSYTDFDGRKILNKLVCGQYRVDEDSYDFHLVVYPSVYLYYDEDTQNYRYFLEEY